MDETQRTNPTPGRSPYSPRHTVRRPRRSARRSLGAFLAGALCGLAIALIAHLVSGGKSPAHHARPLAAVTRGNSRGHSTAPAPVRPARKAAPEEAPILMYHVINPPPSGAPFPGLYVSKEAFAEQMHALKAAGFVAVTLSELAANWKEGAALPPGKPVVITFDNGYRSQYENALPILKELGLRAVENIQLSGLPPSQGGLTESQVRGLLEAGWELDTQGYSHAELTALSASELHFQIAEARRTLQQRYHVPVNWFCYPSGHYDKQVIEAVREAGFVGSTTVVPGWAGPGSEPYRLPRIRVLGGTTGQQLLSLIEGDRSLPPPPPSYTA